MPAEQITYFPSWLADIMAKHLTDAVLNERGIQTNPEADMAAIRKEIEVTI